MSAASLLTRLSDAQAEAVRRVRDAVVEVSRPGRRGGRGAGTHLGGGRVVTCAHVVGSAREVRVRTASGAVGTACVEAVARGDDLALLALPPEAVVHLPALRLGEAPALGAQVLAVGHPGGSVGAASAGVVVGHDEAGRTLTDAHLRPGHSGGALVDATGRLVGVLATLSAPDLGGAVRPEAVRALLTAAGAVHG
ncbi:MAG: serine protease [Bacteroidota bacterium]